MRITRSRSRPWCLLSLLLVVAVFTAACGDDDGSSDSEATETAPSGSTDDPAPQDGDGPFPVTIEHAFGETTIESEPVRVATLGFTDHDTVLALGVTPVLVREWFGEQPYATWPWGRDLIDGEPEVMTGVMNFEQIAAADPDVIIAEYAGLTDDEYELLSEIAPTVAQSGEYASYLTPWQEMTIRIGRTLGKQDQAESLIADVEAQFATVRTEHPELSDAMGVAVNTREDGTFGVRGPDDARGRFLASLGLGYPDEIAAAIPDGEFVAPISFERIDLLANGLDVVVWAPESEDDRAFVEGLNLYPGEDRLVFIDDQEAAALGFSSVLSLPWAIDHIVPRLVAAADGDPATSVDP